MTDGKRIDDVDSPVFVVPKGASLTNHVKPHLPAVDADGRVRPACLHGKREDRRWRLVGRHAIPLRGEELCKECDPDHTPDNSTQDRSYYLALIEAADSKEVAD